MTKSAGNEYIKRYGLTKKQKEILEQFGIEEKEMNRICQEYSKKLKTTTIVHKRSRLKSPALILITEQHESYKCEKVKVVYVTKKL
ncbi:hypothetical protein CWE04_08675 [Thomasclavelia cocleata]|jgi:hypothetical protein|uniref:Uncharacterized protein n=1 Tax=Thomasclavelia cocleata TaxID=69824 RepID=A0A1I0DL31_9FIRM|nr:hypothetical protein [Thomasclavelia cocleata]MCR1961282.1 hypothetical protein [Thomasclavelia cocleata]NDO42709.1 hypothetical protein [Thomasclavelia cocleata]PJN80487.1 hypothetical protein CWE04_08675 [Thomasclavelia cocleata]SET33211.1 hypothetical protein SAMN04489758_106101 [Thomasclavelia cocleata]